MMIIIIILRIVKSNKPIFKRGFGNISNNLSILENYYNYFWYHLIISSLILGENSIFNYLYSYSFYILLLI